MKIHNKFGELVKRLRDRARREDEYYAHGGDVINEGADAIEKLLKVASAMHTWIFLHTGDEQAVYDECSLTDEMNAELGYCGKFVIESQKEET